MGTDEDRVAVITTEDVAHVEPGRRRGVLLGLLRSDLKAQGMVLLTAGMLRTCAPLLATLHAETPIEEPRPVPGRSLFVVRAARPMSR